MESELHLYLFTYRWWCFKNLNTLSVTEMITFTSGNRKYYYYFPKADFKATVFGKDFLSPGPFLHCGAPLHMCGFPGSPSPLHTSPQAWITLMTHLLLFGSRETIKEALSPPRIRPAASSVGSQYKMKIWDLGRKGLSKVNLPFP